MMECTLPIAPVEALTQVASNFAYARLDSDEVLYALVQLYWLAYVDLQRHCFRPHTRGISATSLSEGALGWEATALTLQS